MDKCREAFESTINEHKSNIAKDMADFGEHKRIKKLHDDVDSEAHNYEWYFTKGAQSRQAEVDQLQSQINEMAEVGLSQESAIREKDKRIERATAKWISIVTILTTTDTGVPDAIFKQLDQLHDALCGMNEIGDNNANY